MFEYFTSETKMDKRKWFIDQNSGLTDLDQFERFMISFAKEKDKFAVSTELEDGSDWIFGWFDSKDLAKEYIKKIYDFLIAE